MNLRYLVLKSLPNQQKYNGGCRLMPIVFTFRSWCNIFSCALLWLVAIIATNLLTHDFAHAQSQLRDITVSWDDGHGTINSTSRGTYTDQTGKVIIPMGDHLDAEAFEYLGSRRLKSSFLQPPDTMRTGFKLGDDNSFVTLTYGHWEVQNYAECTDQTNQGKLCGVVTFVPKMAAINTLVGQTIRSELHLLQIDIVPPNLHYRRTPPAILTATINGQSQVKLSWENNGNGKIPRVEGATEYDNLKGTIFTFDQSENNQITVSVSETKNETITPTTDDTAGSSQTVDGFTGLVYGESDFGYGKWYVAADNRSFLFEPKHSEIQKLNPGDSVISKLEIKIVSSSDSTDVKAMGSIEVEMSRKVESKLSWTSGKVVEEIIAGSSSYSEVLGNIEIINPPANFTVSAVVTETQIGNAADIVNDSLVVSSRSGYKIVGTTSTFSYGSWYINNENTEFIFAPKMTTINALTVGQEITITLEFNITATVGASTTDMVVDTQEIVLKISPPLPKITMVWDNNSGSVGTANIFELTQDGSDEYPLLTGTGPIANFTNELRSSSKLREQLNQGNILEIGHTASHLLWVELGGGHTKYPFVKEHPTIVDGEITNNNNNGIWYLVQPLREDSNNVKRFEFEYKPNAKLINNLQRGDVLTTWIDTLICSANCLKTDVNDEDNDGSRTDSVEVPGVVLARGRATVIIYGPGDPSLELSWENEFNGKIRKQADTDANYQDRRGSVDAFKISDRDRIVTTISEEKTGAPTITETSGSENSDLGFDATLYSGKLVYGSWYFATDREEFVFRPNNDEISLLQPGETVTSRMSLNVVSPSGENVLDSPVTISVTIEAPEVELKWNDGITGFIRQSENASSYNNQSGIVNSEFLPTGHFYQISITESDSNDVVTAAVTAETTSSELGFEARRFSTGLDYGSWFFASDNSQFVFQPNASAINNLLPNAEVRSTISLEPFDSGGVAFLSEPVTISVVIAGRQAEVEIIPEISINAVARTARAGDTLRFNVKSDQNLVVPLEVGITFSESEDQIMWRIPRSVTLDSANQSVQFQIQTKRRYSRDGEVVDFSAAIIESEEIYTISSTNGVATVPVSETGRQLTAGADSRVSVAQSAVDSILDFVNNPNNSQSSSSLIIPRFSIFAGTRKIQEGESLSLRIESDVQVSTPVIINLEINQLSNVVESPNHQVVYSANLSSMDFEIPTIDDNVAEDDITLSIRIVSGSNYKLGVNNSVNITVSDSKDRERKRRGYLDSVNQSIMHTFMEQIGTDTFNLVSERTNHVFIQNGGSKFEFGNNDGLAELFSTGNEILIENQPLRSSLIGQSSFSIELFPERGTDSLTEIWGLGNYQTVQKNSRDSGPSWEGDMYLANIGSDVRVNQNVFAGFAYSFADSQIDFKSYDGSSVYHTSEFHGISPYLSWNSSTHKAKLQVISSVKQGRVEIIQDGFETVSLDNTIYVFGLGGSKSLNSIDTFYSYNPINFSLKGDAWTVQMHPISLVENFSNTKLESSQFNFALEGSQRLSISDNISASPRISFGYYGIQDSLDSDSGFELGSEFEIIGGTGYTLSSEGRVIQNQLNSSLNWKLATEFGYDNNQDRLGLQIQVDHSVSHPQRVSNDKNKIDLLISRANSVSDQTDEHELNFNLGYGIHVLDNSSILTPTSDFRFTDNRLGRIQIGSRLVLGTQMEFGLIGSQLNNTDGVANHQLKFNGSLKW